MTTKTPPGFRVLEMRATQRLVCRDCGYSLPVVLNGANRTNRRRYARAHAIEYGHTVDVVSEQVTTYYPEVDV